MNGPRDRSLTAIIILCAGVLAVAVGMILVTVLGWLDSTPEPVDRTVPACLSEDWVPASGVCLWDASVRGNGRGSSFIRDARGGVWYRVDPQVKG